MKKADKLRAYWSKREADVMLFHPLGCATKCDAHYLSGLFNAEFQKEMESRGYDMATFKFEISPKIGNERFASQRPAECGLKDGLNLTPRLSPMLPKKDGKCRC